MAPYLSRRDPHGQVLDSVDLFVEVLVDFGELVDLQYVRVGRPAGHPVVLAGHVLVLFLSAHQWHRPSATNKVPAGGKDILIFDVFCCLCFCIE